MHIHIFFLKDSALFHINENSMVCGWFLTWSPSLNILTEIDPSRRYSHIYSIHISSNLIDKLTVFPLQQDQYRRNGSKWKPWRISPPLSCKKCRRIGMFTQTMYMFWRRYVSTCNSKSGGRSWKGVNKQKGNTSKTLRRSVWLSFQFVFFKVETTNKESFW